MAETKVFSKDAVLAAIRLTALGAVGCMPKEEAIKVIESLPEDLADMVMEQTIKALKTQAAAKAKAMSKALGLLASTLANGPKEDR